jgi:hypothetical protein
MLESSEPETIRTFLASADQQSFSLVPTRSSLDGGDLVSVLVGINDAIQTEGEPVPAEKAQPGEAERRLPMIPGETNGVFLRSASPDWLMSTASHLIASGGPGAWPVQADPPTGEDWKFQLPADLGAAAGMELAGEGKAPPPGQGEGWHIAILDTAPDLADLQRAYHTWPGHPLLKGLVGPGGVLRIYRSPDHELMQELDEYSLRHHRYLMADHGLFVAGIIHSIAPKATLHLYEVLSPYGVGSVESIAQGLLSATRNHNSDRPLIINCSLVLNVPRDEQQDPDFEFEHPASAREFTCKSLRELFRWVSTVKQATAIAAAGNDGAGGGRPAARYPAAFVSVLGVGGVPAGGPRADGAFHAAPYSNLADDPPEAGRLTFGGLPGAGSGVLGVYISPFPNYAGPNVAGEPPSSSVVPAESVTGHAPTRMPALDEIWYSVNSTGWAWWAGTSFAAPIVSGLAATTQPGPPFPQSVRAFITALRSGNTDKQERVIVVKQGSR